MKFGIREICDVVLKAKAAQKIGNKIFYANEPVLYFDTLKSSSMEGASTTVYAQGGRGNTRLVAWEGERTVTFTMEDALISPEGFMILTGAGLVEAGEGEEALFHHMSETVDATYVHTISELIATNATDALKEIWTELKAVYKVSGESNASANGNGTVEISSDALVIPVTHAPALPEGRDGDYAYVMFVYNGEIVSEPYIPVHAGEDNVLEYVVLDKTHKNYNKYIKDEVVSQKYSTMTGSNLAEDVLATGDNISHGDYQADWSGINYDSFIVDYYVKKTSGVKQIEITADSFGGNFYLEADTLFRDTNGSDLPAQFIIPNCKIQSNFNFTMASSGDPSTFTFTLDAFPGETRWDKSKKVLAAIQIMGADEKASMHRHATKAEALHHKQF